MNAMKTDAQLQKDVMDEIKWVICGTPIEVTRAEQVLFRIARRGDARLHRRYPCRCDRIVRRSVFDGPVSRSRSSRVRRENRSSAGGTRRRRDERKFGMAIERNLRIVHVIHRE